MNKPVKAAIFTSNRSQAVRIPKALAFPEGVKEVCVIREGKTLRLVPAEGLWDDFFAGEPYPDFPDRDQPPMQERDWS